MSFGWLLFVVAAAVGTLAGLHLAAPLLNPIFVAVVLTLVVAPLHASLQRRGLAAWMSLALLLLALVMGVLLVVLVAGYSFGHVGERLREYAARWTQEFEQLDAWLTSVGLPATSAASAVSPEVTVDVFAAVVGGLFGLASTAVLIVIMTLFFLAEGAALVGRLRDALGEANPAFVRLTAYGRDVGRYFALRAAVNAATGAGVTIVLFLFGVDFPVLWGVVTFFLSFIPYIGMFLASVPSVLLAVAEFGLGRALIVVIALTVVNAFAENLLQPTLMSRGLRISPTFVFVSLLFWTWLLGGSGSFLAIPLSLGVVATLTSFASSRWLAATVTVRSAHDDPALPEA
jgi:predicted PurR-regulated permease PerM